MAIDPMALANMIGANLRPVTSWDNSTTPPTPIFDPPLTTAEQATLASLMALLRTTVDLSPADWTLIEARLPNLRAFRQQTRNAFMALTQTERDRAIFDALQDIIAVIVALVRDK